MAKVTFNFRSVKAKADGRTLYMALAVLDKEETIEFNDELITTNPSVNILLDSDRQDEDTIELLDAYAQGHDIEKETVSGIMLRLMGESRSFEVDIKNSHLTGKYKAAANNNVSGGVAIYGSLTLDGKVKVLEALIESLDEFEEESSNAKSSKKKKKA